MNTQSLLDQCHSLIKELEFIQSEIKTTEGKQKYIELKEEELTEEKATMLSRENAVNKKHSEISVLLEKVETVRKDNKLIEQKLEEQKQMIIEEQKKLDILYQLKIKLEAKEATLNKKEQELLEYKIMLQEQKNLIQKEKLIDKERKEVLDSRESLVNKELARIQAIKNRI